MNPYFKISDRKIGSDYRPFLIAEIGQAHEGSLGILYSYIDAIAQTGVDAVKFQMHIAEAESSEHEPFRVKFSLEDKSRFDYWKRMGFSLQQWKDIKNHCDDLGLEFMCSPFSNLAVDWLEEIGVQSYKIGSGEVNNFLILEKIAQTGKPVILSSGMSSYEELDKTVLFLNERNVDFAILQCTTAYPTKPDQYGLNIIQELKNRYNVPVGFSDHSAKIETCIAATTLRADILEFHVVFDRQLFGPDSKSSLTISETKDLVVAVKNIKEALVNPINKNENGAFSELKQIFEKSLAVNKDLPKNHVLTFDDLESKKPKGFGIEASRFKEVIGKTINKDLKKWNFLNECDLL
ncbi:MULTISPECIES: N-acetylneuraminate synthase family protein [Flavobacterium]|uniref:N-acetylneuraminate synthase family protein n=1 Tax=Flavobacterium TaxID=237 RepID=UPI001182013A|nr:MULTISPECIES: N-acetylneuraminate synthase family protein [Flavobacterium]MCR4030948.1 N-acetylneuraminate synthase family protein [Flavobacterium panacis]